MMVAAAVVHTVMPPAILPVRMASTVVINARAAARPELGGVERWSRELTERLPELRPDRYRIATPPRGMEHRTGHLWEQLVLPTQRADLLLCPANLAPVLSRRSVVVIHDVAPLRDPTWYSPAYVRWQRFVLPRIARNAVRILTPSQFSAAEVSELLGVRSDKIAVVAGACDRRFSPQADAERARRVLGIGEDPYVLTVGSRTARKNIRILDGPAVELARRGVAVLAAGGGRPQFRRESDAGVVRQLGAVSDDLLPGLYAGAAAFVLPSLYEGFGLTALEAMASGVPVVASNTSALPEVCGDAAQLIDPNDPAAIAAALLEAVAAPEQWSTAGLKRAQFYSWAATASAVDAELAGLLGWS